MIAKFLNWLLGYNKYKISYSLVYPESVSHFEIETEGTSPEDAELTLELAHYANGNRTEGFDSHIIINTVTLIK